MFEWDRNNLRKIRAHNIEREGAEHALLNDPIPICEQLKEDSGSCTTAKQTRDVWWPLW
jgi:hypothetical protein